MVGIVALSFGLIEGYEPSICNKRLARNIALIYLELTSSGAEPIVVAQWEIALALKEIGVPVHRIVDRTPGMYLDSEGVISAADRTFKHKGITEVVVVANPFVHIVKCKMLVRKLGYEIIPKRIEKIGFDNNSDQPWTRGPIRLILYSAAQVLWGLKGKPST